MQPARTKREAQLLAEGKPPFKTAIWFGPGIGWGYKMNKRQAAIFEAAKRALS